MKRIFSLLLALSALFCLSLTVYAHDVPQERDDCSIEVVVRYDGKNVSGGTLTAVKVGFVDEDNGDYFFSRVFDDVRLDDVQTADAAAQLNEFYSAYGSQYEFYMQTVSVSDGKATFTGLSTGLYLIFQEKAADGYSKLNAFLVGVPYMNDGAYQYNVTAAMKAELERQPEPSKPAGTTPTTPTDPKLPQTGQLNWPVPVLVVSGLMLFAFGWILCFGRKKENYEE